MLSTKKQKKVACVGIGNEFRGDDAVGVYVVQNLKPLAEGREDVFVFESASIPESCTGPIKRFDPDLVIMIDAALMESDPGTIQWIDPMQIEGLAFSTHSFPLRMLAEYLINETGCEIRFIGVEPDELDFDTPMTPPVQTAADQLVADLSKAYFQ
jgi:hydrogenase 3 maturation protease